MDEVVTKEDFVLWKQDKVTQALYREVKVRMSQIQEALLRGRASDFSDYKALLGAYQALESVLYAEFWSGSEESQKESD
ncbi:MAG: hypothetical protein WDZ61_00335 [Parcubacteria group bacterium]